MKILNWGTWTCVAIAAISLSRPAPAFGQSVESCDGGKPFTALLIDRSSRESPDGTQIETESRGRMARDSTGMLYSEWQLTRAGGLQDSTRSERENNLSSGHENERHIASVVSITDCRAGKVFTILPDTKTLRVTNKSVGPRKRQSGSSLFDFLTKGPRPPNVEFQDLGLKQIENVMAHGYKEVFLETADAQSARTVQSVDEFWVSDDLALVVSHTQTNARGKSETRLTNIEQIEPDASLFQLPIGYELEARPEETKSER